MRVLIGLVLTASSFGANLSAIGGPRLQAFEARGRQYVSRGPGYSLTVSAHAAILNLTGHAVRMSIVGASRSSELQPLDQMPGKANYILGRDIRASYDLFARLRWRGVYPGIDAVFRGNQDRLEYDFEIGAARDPAKIRVDFAGIDDLGIDSKGDLVMRAGAMEIHQPKPVAYQVVRGERRLVDASYWIDGSKTVRFRMGAYDRRRCLVIDPQIVFDNVLEGSGISSAAGLARGSDGGLYIAGVTNATNFPVVNPFQNHLGSQPLLATSNAGQTWTYPPLRASNSVSAIVAAPSAPMTVYAATPSSVLASADGGTTWATAGLAGATALAVDASSAATVYAATSQGLFVTTNSGLSWQASTNGLPATSILAVAAHPTQPGTVFASTAFPASIFRSTDFGQTWTRFFLPIATELAGPTLAIVLASNGGIIVASNSGLIVFTDGGNTFAAGPSQGVQNNQSLAIAPNNPSVVYLVNASGLQKSSDGGQTFTVVLPGVQFSQFARVAVDPRNPSTVYAADTNLLYESSNAGQTWSQLSLPYPVTPFALFVSPADSRLFLGTGTQNNVFVTKWSADGVRILYSTYLGGSQMEAASGIAVDGSGSAYVTGFTFSPDFPTTEGAFQTKLTNAPNVFAAKLSPDGSQLVYSTLIGSASEFAGIAVDASGDAVITGLTQGNFPVTANAFQSTPGAGCASSEFNAGEAFVTKVAPDGKSLIYSTYFGGSCPVTNVPVVAPSTFGAAVAVDASGNAWVVGSTLTPDLPVTSDALQSKFGGGPYDGFVARFNPSGGLDYATYVGGTGFDSLVALAFDASGNIFLTGATTGLSQPATPNAYQSQASANCPVFSPGPSFPIPAGNALVMKLDPTAHSVLGLTYLGAPLCLAPSSIAVDSAGDPWIVGGIQYYPSAPPTVSPILIGIGRGFMSQFSADFSQLLFSTYFDAVAGIALDSLGLAYAASTGPPNSFGIQPVYIDKIDPTPAPVSPDSIVSFVPSLNPSSFPGISAGELIRILGKRMGPAAAVSGILNSGVLATSVAGVQVYFDGTPVPLLSVSDQEIDLVAPFELAAKSNTTLGVSYNNGQSNAIQVAVTPMALEVLAVLNEDFSLNSAANPAKAGSIMSLYLAGAGQTNPPSQDGHVNVAPLAAPGTPLVIEYFDNLGAC